MARKSRVAGNVIDTIPAKKGIYRTGIYARLSSEDKEEDTLEHSFEKPCGKSDGYAFGRYLCG